MVAKKSRKSSKGVSTLKSKSLSAGQARAVKGGIIAVLRKESTINWGDKISFGKI